MSGYMPPAQRTDWGTPPELFDVLDAEFGPFTCDPACNGSEHSAAIISKRGGLLCVPPDADMSAEHFALNETYYRRDGLTQSWEGKVYLNPPYGRELPRWIEKAVAEVEAGHCERVVALIPARTDTKCWQRYVVKQIAYDAETDGSGIDAHQLLHVVRFLPGRVKFVGGDGPAPFPSAIVVWEL